MSRAAQANWSRLPNHNPPRFYTAWTQSGHTARFGLSSSCRRSTGVCKTAYFNLESRRLTC